MGLLDALQLGANALTAHQAAIQVAGNNIANSATPGYTRQEAVLTQAPVSKLAGNLTVGTGVQVSDVRSIMDAAIDARLRDALSQVSSYLASEQALTQVESLMNELTDTDLSTAMNELFNSFSALAASPEDLAQRALVVQRAEALSNRFSYLRGGLERLQADMTAQLEGAVAEADRLASAIAEVNLHIVASESSGQTAASLRDDRNALISQLSELIDVTVHEDANGAANVFIGSEPLVFQTQSHGLEIITQSVGDEVLEVVAFADNDSVIKTTGGKIAGLQTTRDGEVADVIERLDTLARQVIWQVNRIHTQGTTLTGMTELTGTYQVDDADAAIDSDTAGLDFQPSNGSFLLTVTVTGPDGGETVSTYQIDVSLTGAPTDTTANTLAAAIDAANDLTAEINIAGKLAIRVTNTNATVSFSEDSSGVLAALGVNTFFTGRDSGTIAVTEAIADDAGLIAAGRSGQDGDGTNATALAELADANVTELLGMTLSEYHQRLVADVAVWTAGAADMASANEIVYESVLAQRESISGVSIDEETIDLIRYEAAFRGAARFISVVQELLDTLLALV